MKISDKWKVYLINQKLSHSKKKSIFANKNFMVITIGLTVLFS